MTIREEIDAQFPIRKTTAQKRAFEKWVMAKMREMGYRPYVDGMNRKDKLRHRNIVAGDPQNAELLIISAQTEADIAELESYEEKQIFLEDMGLKESGCDRLIKAIYHLLDLQTFITAGEMEVKAWTFRKGWKAPQCAGVIHTDFEKGFIRAEVIKYDDYIRYGSEAAVREAGKMGVEGKDYVVQDGDIMHFRFNV